MGKKPVCLIPKKENPQQGLFPAVNATVMPL